MRDWFAKFDGSVGFDTRDLTVVAGEDVGFCHSLNRMGAATGEGEFEMWFRTRSVSAGTARPG